MDGTPAVPPKEFMAFIPYCGYGCPLYTAGKDPCGEAKDPCGAAENPCGAA